MASSGARAGVPDFVLLEQITQPAVIDNLLERYKHDTVYTFIRDVVVSLNPYKPLPIYGPAEIERYRRKEYGLAPHIYSVADRAYRDMVQTGKRQCVIISGESGAGKTEASKTVMQYISAVSGASPLVDHIKGQLLECNPVLEAFGNAKTRRNDNSSRFGKYMDIQFDYAGDVVGGRVEHYLLEKARVVHQNEGERNFHIFYFMLAGLSDSALAELHLERRAEAYPYLVGGHCTTVDGVNDKREFEHVLHGLNTIGVPASAQASCWRILAAILHLGRLEFDEASAGGSATSHIADTALLQQVAALLIVPAEKLSAALTTRSVTAGSEKTVMVQLNPEQAYYTRDAFAKALYDKLFAWLIREINKVITHDKDRSPNMVIGVLDIYGFEVFEKNSFEQFTINYANERLQQLFIELTLKSEQEEYLAEGIEWTPVEYFNNDIICDLIEKRGGILDWLDEECLLSSKTDATFLEKLDANLAGHAHYESRRTAQGAQKMTYTQTSFCISHYAGKVVYDVSTFLDKNKDTLYADLVSTAQTSPDAVMRSMFEEVATPAPSALDASMELSTPAIDVGAVNAPPKFLARSSSQKQLAASSPASAAGTPTTPSTPNGPSAKTPAASTTAKTPAAGSPAVKTTPAAKTPAASATTHGTTASPAVKATPNGVAAKPAPSPAAAHTNGPSGKASPGGPVTPAKAPKPLGKASPAAKDAPATPEAGTLPVKAVKPNRMSVGPGVSPAGSPSSAAGSPAAATTPGKAPKPRPVSMMDALSVAPGAAPPARSPGSPQSNGGASPSKTTPSFKQAATTVVSAQNVLRRMGSGSSLPRASSSTDLGGFKRKRPVTAGTQFKTQLNALIKNLLSAKPHYIRCIKPNGEKKRDEFNADLVEHQVRYLGLLENVRVARAGFCAREQFGRFLFRYRLLSPTVWPVFSGPDSEACVAILRSLDVAATDFQCGKTKIFVRLPSTVFMLEDRRQERIPWVATRIQACTRRFLCETKYTRYRAAELIQATWKGSRQRKKYTRYMAARAIQLRFRGHLARVRYERLLASIVLQRLGRGFLARRRAKAERAARMVQRSFRAHRTRRIFLRLWAESVIRAAMLGFMVRRKFALIKQRALDEKDRHKMFKLATVLQRIVRGTLARLKYKKSKAATAIQAGWRGHQGRKHVARVRAAVQIQACMRMFLVRRRYKRTRAAIRLQAFWRMYSTRRAYRRWRNVWRMQRWARRVFSRRFLVGIYGQVAGQPRTWPTHPVRRGHAECERLLRDIYRKWKALMYRKRFPANRKPLYEHKMHASDLFRGKKALYPSSVAQPLVGDALELSTKHARKLTKMLQDDGNTTVSFSANIRKLNRSFKFDNNVLMVTSNSIFRLADVKGCKIKRQEPIARVMRLTVSTQADPFVVLHFPAGGDLLCACDHVIEAVVVIRELFHKATNSALDVNFMDVDVPCNVTKGAPHSISFRDDSAATKVTVQKASKSACTIVSPVGR